MKKLILLSSLLLSFMTSLRAGGWYPLGGNDLGQLSYNSAYYLDMAFDASGNPWVVLNDLQLGWKITVRKFVNGNWETVGTAGFSGSPADYCSIAFDNSGVPYVLFEDYASANKPTVMKYDGSAWVLVGPASSLSGSIGHYSSLAFGSGNTPYIFYSDAANSNRPTIKKYNGTSWVNLTGSAVITNDQSAWNNMTTDAAGNVYVVYQNITSGRPTVKKYNGTSWVNLGSAANISGNNGTYTSIAIDPSGTPYVSYTDNTLSTCVVRKFNGTSWADVGNGISAGSASYTDISFNSSGTPYVAFTDDAQFSRLTVKMYSGSSWVAVGTGPVSAGPAAYNSIRVYNGTPYVLTQDNGYSSKGILRSFANGSWSIVGAYPVSQGEQSELGFTVSRDGKPYLFYFDNYLSMPFVKSYTSNGWTTVSDNAFDFPLNYPAIAGDSSGNVYTACYNHLTSTTEVRKYNGSTWTLLTTAASFGTISPTAIQLKLDASGTPYVFVLNSANNRLIVKKYGGGTSWTNVGSNGDASGIAASYPSAAIGPDGSLYVSFVEISTVNARVRKFNGTAWVNTGSTVVTGNTYSSLAIAQDGTPYYCFRDDANGFLGAVKKYNGSTWVAVGSAFSTGQAENPQVFIDAGGTPYVAYMDAGNDNKMTVKRYTSGNWSSVGAAGFSLPMINPILQMGLYNNSIYTAYNTQGIFAKVFHDCGVPVLTVTANTGSSVCPGSQVIYTATATDGGINPVYNWYQNGSLVSSGVNLTTYTTSLGSSTQVYCTVTNACGSDTSNVSAISVSNIPQVTGEPLDTAACEGTPYYFAVTAAGGGLSYQWQISYDGNSWNNLPGDISPVLSHSTSAFDYGSRYRAIVSNSCGSDTSATAFLTVRSPAYFITTISDDTVSPGETVTLATHMGLVTAPFSFSWERSTNNGGSWSPISGATDSVYQFVASSGDNGNKYRAKVNNICGLTTGAAQTLTVQSNTGSLTISTTQNPACAGASVSFTASPTNGGASPSYAWQLNGSPVAGATASTWTYSAFNNGDQVSCVMNGNIVSNTVIMNINAAPTASITPGSAQTICSGQSVTLNASTGSGVTYQWLNNGTAIGGATNASYTANASGSYSVQVTNSSGCGAISASTGVTVTSCGPSITSLGTTSLCQGGSLTIDFSNGGGSYNANNVFTAQLSNASGSFASPVSLGTLSGTAGGTINGNIATGQALGSGYRIRIVASNPAIAGSDNGTNLSVNARPTSAQATITNTGALTFCQGGSTSLSVPATAGLSYQWYLNNTAISGATASTYIATAAGTYYADVITAAGCSRSSATKTVNVNALPAATLSPSSTQTVCAGQSVSFQANTGSGFTYKWYKDGVLINAATNSAYTASAAGNYSVQVTNATSCSNTSAAVSLVVNPLPSVQITPGGPTSFCAGSAVTLQASGASTYVWSNTIPGSSITATTAGSYTVTGTDANGCQATSAPITVTVNSLPPASVTPSAPQTLCSGQTLALQANTGTGLSYQWLSGGVPISGATNISYTAASAGNYSVQVTNAAGCGAASQVTVVTAGNCGPAITALSTTSLCQGGSVAITFTNGGGSFNANNVFTAQLSSAAGSFASPVNIGTLSGTIGGTINANIAAAQAAGSGYRIRVISSNPAMTGADNGTNLSVTARPTSGQAVISNTGGLTFCQGGSTLLSVPNTAGLSYQWYRDNAAIAGATANGYTASAAGVYYADVINSAGCSRSSATKTVTVNALPIATLSPSAAQTLCPGQTVSFQANTGTGLSYKWYKDNVLISGATLSSFTASAAGSYAVQVTNASNCSATSASVSVLTGSCGAEISGTGTINACQGSQISLAYTATGFNAGNVFTLQLSDLTGSFTNAQDIGTVTSAQAGNISGNIPAGTPAGSGYKLRITSTNPATTGPVSALILKVQAAVTDSVRICAVTVDNATGKNLLVWNKPGGADIDSFVIYRNTASSNTFQRIGAQAFSAFSSFTDNSANPSVQASRYYITAKNSCGETVTITKHRTMHLTINKGQDLAWNLIWNGYEGFTHGSYNIWRGSTSSTLSLLTTVEANSYNSYTDLTAPAGSVFYMVSVADGPACNPTARTTAGFEISSNIASSGVQPEANWMDLDVYPNPSANEATVLIQSSFKECSYTIRVLDLTGRVQEVQESKPGKSVMIGARLAAGIYTIEVSGNGQRTVRKFNKL